MKKDQNQTSSVNSLAAGAAGAAAADDLPS